MKEFDALCFDARQFYLELSSESVDRVFERVGEHACDFLSCACGNADQAVTHDGACDDLLPLNWAR